MKNQVTEAGVVAVIGRWMPIHNGHKAFLIDLARKYDKIIVMIGSCYDNGTQRNCIPAVEREKMLRAIFKREEIPTEKYEIVPIADTESRMFGIKLEEYLKKNNAKYVKVVGTDAAIEVAMKAIEDSKKKQ